MDQRQQRPGGNGNPRIVGREEWLEARMAHLEHEKAHLKAHDRLMEERRALPWVRIDKNYVFDTEAGERSLEQLFDGRSQLILYHFMFAPDWEEGCDGCSFVADHFDGANLHLAHHDVTLVAASRAPLARLLAYKARMGWQFPWVSSGRSDFNRDFGVSFTPQEIAAGTARYNYGTTPESQEEAHGISVFVRRGPGDVCHSYSSYARGCDPLIGAHAFLDLTPLGRNERGTMDWVRRHDRYGQSGQSCHDREE